jgi:hypothetical protein
MPTFNDEIERLKMDAAKRGELGSAIISDHAFRVGPGAPWWDRCWYPGCHLSAAAHTTTEVAMGPDPALPYRCPDCVMTGVDPCPHQS